MTDQGGDQVHQGGVSLSVQEWDAVGQEGGQEVVMRYSTVMIKIVLHIVHVFLPQSGKQ